MVATWLALAWTAACTPVLQIETESGLRGRLDLGAQARFSVTYWHSMYQVPFTEDYVIDPDHVIRLDALRSAGDTVSDYFALEGRADEVRELRRRFASLSLLVGARQAQILRIGARTWSFHEFGGPGARVVFAPGVDCRVK